MITNKTVCKIQQSLTFLQQQFIDAVVVTFVAMVLIFVVTIAFVFYVDTISITITISSHLVTEVSATLFKYLLFSQIYVLGFQL